MTTHNYTVVYFVVNHDISADLSAALHREHIRGASVMPAWGAVRNSILTFFCLDEVRKDIVFFVEETNLALRLLREMAVRFKLDKRNRGIAFALPVSGIYGVRDIPNREVARQEAKETMWQAIYTIVNKGDAGGVVDAATEAGARGGTILRGRGSAQHTGAKLFDFPIEPEKEVVLVLAPREKTSEIVAHIHAKMHIDDPGRGIIFVMDVTEAYGLVDQN